MNIDSQLTWLYPQHEQFVSKMQSELQALLSRSVVQDCVDEGHDGSLQTEVITVGSSTSVQLVHYALETSSFACILLVMDHCF